MCVCVSTSRERTAALCPRDELMESIEEKTTKFFGRYQLLLEMAQGGMAALFLARIAGPEKFEKLLVIKKIHDHLAQEDEFIAMFLDEARIAALIHHPNVVTIFDMGQVQKARYIAMEYVHGHNLAELMRAAKRLDGQLPWNQAVRIVADAAAGLQAAHDLRNPEGRALNVVHRDVSPQNILISYDGHVKVVDFGIAYAAEKISQTSSGTVKGKMAYMSPEQATSRKLDRRSDIFSLGIVLWEAVCLKRLFKEETDAATLYRVIEAQAPKPRSVRPDLPVELEKVIMKALSKDADDRYETCGEFEEALEKVLYGQGEVTKDTHVSKLMNRVFHDQKKIKEEQIQLAMQANTGQPVKAIGMGGEITSSPAGLNTDSLIHQTVKKPVPVFALVSVGLLVTAVVFLLAILLTRPDSEPTRAEPAPEKKPLAIKAPMEEPMEPPRESRSRPMPVREKPRRPEKVTLRVVIRPNKAQARLSFKGRRYKGPVVELKVRKSDKKEKVTVKAKGFITEEFTITPQKDREIFLNLQPIKAKSWVRWRPRRGRTRKITRLKPLPL